jgi:serine/threonine protein phosphatase Stp1
LVASSCYTHPGNVRQNNEDSYYASDDRGLWVVCDGMGGHQEGNFASHLVTDIFERMQLTGSFDDKIEAINSQLYNIHLILQKKAQKTGRNAVIGTTVVVLLIEGRKGACMHAGDSRCYLLREERISLVTEDHAREIETPKGPRKVLVNALSAPGQFYLETKKFTTNPGDAYLLCSDGLYDKVNAPVMHKAMAALDLDAGLDAMASMVLSKRADDNLTAVVVRIKE